MSFTVKTKPWLFSPVILSIPEKVAFETLDFISAGPKALLAIAKQDTANATKNDLPIEFMKIEMRSDNEWAQ